jgi:hypothetical protein
MSDKLELVATIKDALQQQIHVFTDALDWEKITSGHFTLEMQPVAIVPEVRAVMAMMVGRYPVLAAAGTLLPVRCLVAGRHSGRAAPSLP